MKKIEFFSVNVSGDSLDGTSLRFYKSNSFKDFRFSSYPDAERCFDKLIKTFKTSIELYNLSHKHAQYDVVYEDYQNAFYCIVYKNSLSLVPCTLKIKISSKSMVIDSFDFNFKL